MKDEDKPVFHALREFESIVIKSYRAKYPDGPLWQDLSHETRSMWVKFIEDTK